MVSKCKSLISLLPKFSVDGMFYAAALISALLMGSVFAAGSAQAQTASNVTITSEIKIERITTNAAGEQTAVLADPATASVVPGDTVVIVNSYVNVGASPATNFVSINPINANLAFVSVAEDWAELSIDGGRTWGKLEDLTVTEPGKIAVDAEPALTTMPADITRQALPADVTHIRWSFSRPIAPQERGQVSFRAVVR